MKAILSLLTGLVLLAGCATHTLPKGVVRKTNTTTTTTFAGRPARLIHELDPERQILVWDGRSWVLVWANK